MKHKGLFLISSPPETDVEKQRSYRKRNLGLPGSSDDQSGPHTCSKKKPFVALAKYIEEVGMLEQLEALKMWQNGHCTNDFFSLLCREQRCVCSLLHNPHCCVSQCITEQQIPYLIAEPVVEATS